MLPRSRALSCRALFPAFMTLLFGILLCVTQPVQAQTVSTGNDVPRITTEQARQLASVLNDETKRREFLTTLQNLTQAQKGSTHGTQAKLKPDGLGAEILGSATDWSRAVSGQAHTLLRTVVDVRAIEPGGAI